MSLCLSRRLLEAVLQPKVEVVSELAHQIHLALLEVAFGHIRTNCFLNEIGRTDVKFKLGGVSTILELAAQRLSDHSVCAGAAF